MSSYANVLRQYQVETKRTILPHLLLAVLLLFVTPLVFGVQNLDAIATSFVVERFVCLIGILLFTPLCFPEQDQNVRELICSKRQSIYQTLLVRLSISVVLTCLLLLIFLQVMLLGGSAFPFGSFFFGSISTALFLGAAGFAAACISNNIVAGYLVSLGVYTINLFSGQKLGVFYLFSLSNGDLTPKYWLLLFAVLLFFIPLLSLWLFQKRRR